MRILIYVHGHPRLQAGGSEMAAYALFQEMKARGQPTTFLGVAENAFANGRPALCKFGEDGSEYVMPSLVTDHFLQLGGHRKSLLDDIVRLAGERSIEVMHFHHILGLGTDGLIYLRKRLPDVAFVFTAHEYLSICARHGQMLMADLAGRCTRPEPEKCSRCLKPETAGTGHSFPAYFALRESLFRQVFAGFDAVISPSRFLAERLEEARITSSEVQVIENLNANSGEFRQDAGDPSGGVNRVGFFGQMNPFKGADVLLDAARLLGSEPLSPKPELHFFGMLAGDNLSYPYFISHKLSGMDGVTWHGAYDGRQVVSLMREVDWVVVPSIWWENSPVVIEEALIAGRPIICSNIGGMAEKVVDGLFGLHFEVGNAADLASKLKLACGNEGLWRKLVANRRRPASAEAVAERHLELYRAALESARRRRVAA